MSGGPDPVRTSRRLAYVLRHDPGSVGVILDVDGWVEVDVLLPALAAHGLPLTAEELAAVVAAGPKRRFALTGGRIRAVHGHSVPVDLGLTAAAPPEILFHGTVGRFLPGIRRSGLQPRTRRHVHLSADAVTARDVAARHGGDVVLLTVAAAELAAAGQPFYPSSSGVWLTGPVPVSALGGLPD